MAEVIGVLCGFFDIFRFLPLNDFFKMNQIKG